MTTPPQSLPGALIAGKYRVEGTLGRGGMGVVVAATNEMLGHRVAVKLLHAHIAESSEQVTRLLREARVVAQLRSEHVARVLDVDRLEDGNPFVVLEYLAGQDLAAVLLERRSLPIEEAVDYILQALDVIAEAHGKELVHRDLKPSNLFLTTKNDGSSLIKVLDFGIAKTTGSLPDFDQALTAGQIMMGSPAYMSPEQIREARSVDARADIWSIGVILYELISGENPFRAATVGSTFSKIFSREYTPLVRKHPETPDELSRIVDDCLEPDVSKRIQDVGTLAGLLSPFASERGRRAALGVTSVLSNATLTMGSAITPRALQQERPSASSPWIDVLEARASAVTLESEPPADTLESEPRLASLEATALSTTTIVATGEHPLDTTDIEQTPRRVMQTHTAIAGVIGVVALLIGVWLAATRAPTPSALDGLPPQSAERALADISSSNTAPVEPQLVVPPHESVEGVPSADSADAAPLASSQARQQPPKAKAPIGNGKVKQRVSAHQPKQPPFNEQGLELDRRD